MMKGVSNLYAAETKIQSRSLSMIRIAASGTSAFFRSRVVY